MVREFRGSEEMVYKGSMTKKVSDDYGQERNWKTSFIIGQFLQVRV